VRRSFPFVAFEIRIFVIAVGNNIPIIPILLPPRLCSLRENWMGPDAGKALAETLKINTTITDIK
jgi:hypothetical protein